MSPSSGTRSKSKREVHKENNKEDVKHILEEVWDFSPEECFYKIFKRETSKGIQDILDLSKDDLRALEWVDNKGDIVNLSASEVGKIRSLARYNDYRQAKGNWPLDAKDLRYNDISIDDWENFIRDPTSTRMLIAAGDIASNPPPGFAGSSKSSSNQLTLAESFKRSVKRDSSQFNNFKEGKYWDTWRRNTLATARAQNVDEVLDPSYSPSTAEEQSLFNEKQKFMCSVFSTTLQTD